MNSTPSHHRRLHAAAAALAGACALLAPASAGADLGDTTFRWGGYVKLDTIYSTSSRGITSDVVDYVLVPGAIIVPNPDDAANFHLSARESRLWFRTSTETPQGPLATHIEIDFMGFDANLGNEITSNSSSPRLRHAYGTWRGLLAGQYWSTWMDLAALPEVNDFGSPAGRVFARQAQIRYTHDLGGGSQLEVAVENPENTLRIQDPGDASHGTQIVPSDDLVPDTVAKYTLRGAWGHVAAAGMARLVRHQGAYGAGDDTQLGFGGRLSGKIMLGGKHNLRFAGTYGRGIGRYVAFGAYSDGEVDTDGDVQLIDVAATLLSGQIWLTDTTRINLAFSLSQALNHSETLAGSVNERLVSTHGNVMWSVLPNLRLALEHIFAHRTIEDAPGDDTGFMHRVQASVRYTF